MRILLVDDDPDIRLLVGTVLESRGHIVETAEDGEQGILLACSSRPEVILLDGIMPKLDGVDVLARLRDEDTTRHLPVVFLSALEDEESLHRVHALGVDHVLPKPVDLDTLSRILEQIAAAMRDG